MPSDPVGQNRSSTWKLTAISGKWVVPQANLSPFVCVAVGSCPRGSCAAVLTHMGRERGRPTGSLDVIMYGRGVCPYAGHEGRGRGDGAGGFGVGGVSLGSEGWLEGRR